MLAGGSATEDARQHAAMLVAQLIAHYRELGNGASEPSGDIADSPPAGTTGDAPTAEGHQVEDRDALREAQDEEYRRALAADEAQQRLQEPVDHEAVRAARLRHWLQSS